MEKNNSRHVVAATRPRIVRPCHIIANNRQDIKHTNSTTSVLKNQKSVEQKTLQILTNPETLLGKCPSVTWNEILSVNSDDLELQRSRKDLSSNSSSTSIKPQLDFQLFDPVKTVHFLIAELKEQIRKLLPDDQNVLNIVRQIQYTVKRLTLLSTQNNNNNNNNQPTVHDQQHQSETQYESNNNDTLTDRIDKLQENYIKSEENCRNLEATCHRLSHEKCNLETELNQHKLEITHLKRDINSLQRQLEESNLEIMKIKSLDERCKYLQTEIKTLKLERDCKQYSNVMVDDLRLKHQQSLNKISLLEMKCSENEQKDVIAKLENEKMSQLLQCHENHAHQMQTEFYDIHQLIKEQLQILDINYDKVEPPPTNTESTNIVIHKPSTKSIKTDSAAAAANQMNVSGPTRYGNGDKIVNFTTNNDNRMYHRNDKTPVVDSVPKLNVPQHNHKSPDNFHPNVHRNNGEVDTTDAAATNWPHNRNHFVSLEDDIEGKLNAIFDISIPPMVTHFSDLSSDAI